ncbi:hypothetical protein ACN28E_50255 [Archangium lansingense]|uniref:hypothetical protein n=1 Tax=Archangium lansingense TaxID=2995310 RepID=UPI003B78D7D6
MTEDKDSKPQRAPLRMELGFAGTIRLVASPITELTLNRPTSPLDPGVITVDRLKKPIVVTGNYKGTTEKVIPANLVWLIHYYNPPDYNEVAIPGRMHIDKDGSFQFKAAKADNPEGHPELDVLRHRLFGKGSVGYRLTPQYPHAPSETMPPGLIEFDIPLDVKFNPVPDPAMGSRLQFMLDKDWAVEQLLQSGHKVRLVIDEEDAGEAKVKKGYQDLRVELLWGSANMNEALSWLIGCSATSIPENPRLDYPEAKEEKDFEFSYRLLIDLPEPKPPPKGKKVKTPAPLEARKSQPLVKVPRPALESFSLSFEPAREGHEPRLVARGEIAGLARGIIPTVDISLWRRAAKAEGRFTRVNGSMTIHVDAGRFEAVVHTLPLDPGSFGDDPLWEWASTYAKPGAGERPEPALFATVCINPGHLSQPKLPACASLDFDAGRFDAFDEGRGVISSPLAGGSICSSESKSGSAVVASLMALFTRVAGG